jgi:hypothetical protein
MIDRHERKADIGTLRYFKAVLEEIPVWKFVQVLQAVR